VILTNNGALTIDARAVNSSDVVYQGGIAVRASTGAVYVFGNTPAVLAQSAIPFILAGGTGGTGTQFTISATGALSTLPTLPITSGNAFIYMPTGITGLASGWYYALILSATTAQLYTATYTSGDPRLAVPASPTAPSGITAGSYTQSSSTINALQLTVPGGSIGPNGSIEGNASWLHNASANTKTITVTFDGASLTVWQQTLSTPATRYDNRFGIANVNSQSAQTVISTSFTGGYGGTAVTDVSSSVNTATDKTLAWSLQLNTAASSDFVILRYGRAEVRYGT
jgi:hypothetical protein